MSKGLKNKGKVVFVRGCSLMVFACVVGASAPAFAGQAGERGARQQDRISQGIKSGALTRPEARKLRAEQKKIRVVKKRAARDGKVSVKERRKIERLQKKASRNISSFKHNNRRRR